MSDKYVDALQSETPNTEVAKRFGTSESKVRRDRKKLQSGKTVESPGFAASDRTSATEESSDGSFSTEWIRSRAVTLKDAEDWVRSSGKNPDDYNITARSIAYGEGLWSNRMSASPKAGAKQGFTFPSADELLDVLDRWEYKPSPLPKATGGSFVICPADPQIGKTDWGGGTEDTIKRMMESYFKAADFCREYKPCEIVIADLGDPIENINNTSSQRGTNDRSLTEQIRVARRVALEGIKLLAPLTPSLIYAAVPSNHGSVRIGPKSPENHALDDYGIEIAEQLRDIADNSEKLANVRVVIPEAHHESLCLTTSHTTLGLAHGHQANSPDQLGKWWGGQSHGRMPMADADIALFGHWHSLRVQQSGDARWLFVSPAQDNGSSWFTNKTGESSVTGMLSFTTHDGTWDNLRIL